MASRGTRINDESAALYPWPDPWDDEKVSLALALRSAYRAGAEREGKFVLEQIERNKGA